jgi:transcriptional regulator with XRE-family HTH domain
MTYDASFHRAPALLADSAGVLSVPEHQLNWLATALPDLADQKEYAKERCIVAVTEAVGMAMERAKLTRSEVAERLGKHKSYVTRALNGAHNMTLRTLGEILWACDAEVRDLDLAKLGVVHTDFDLAFEWVVGRSLTNIDESTQIAEDAKVADGGDEANYALAA